MLPPRRRSLEIGVALIVVGVPLIFFPLSFAPFLDPKMVLVLAGALAIWGARLPANPRLAAAAAVWVAAMAIAGVFGVDRWWSLLGPENWGTGVLLLATCAFLLVSGAGIPAALVERLPVWIVGMGTAVSAVAIAYRLAPGVFDRLIPNLSFQGSTVGQVGLLSGLAAACLVASVALREVRGAWLVGVLVIMASGLALAAERSGWVAAAVGLTVALRRVRLPRARVLLMVGTIVGTLAAWTVADAFLPPTSASVSAALRFGQLSTGSALARLDALVAVGRGFTRRPILGWGPGNTWSAYLSSATPAEVKVAARGWADAHNIFAESAVTTGVVGLAALLVLAGLTTTRILRAPPSSGWAVGTVAALAVNHLLQPLSVSLTPLLFLLAGVAAAGTEIHGRSTSDRTPISDRVRPIGRPAVGALLAAGLVLSVLVLAASVLEQYGRTYNSEWALRESLRLVPGRVTSAEALSISLALDGRARDEAAAREARSLIDSTVRLHFWNPGVRLIASDVDRLLYDPAGARAWVQRQLALFPADVATENVGVTQPTAPPAGASS